MGVLYIVATPLGNLEDITLRAISTLKEADAIACEDTRHSLKLLSAYEIRKPLKSIRSQNEEQGARWVIDSLTEGKTIAYITDAGTPGISDPGQKLVSLVRAAGHPVIPIPGPSAFSALVSVAGFPGRSVLFEGFLSPKGGKRRSRLKDLDALGEHFLVYESPFRIIKLLEDIADTMPERVVFIGREMTKSHEEYLSGPVESVLGELQKREKILGEFSVLVSGKKKS